MTVTLLRGNALALPLADATVDLIVTSPPYFGLRSYQDGGQHYAGQIGSEATPAEWVEAMLAATAEMVRVLKPCGSIWVNLGDKYAGGGGQWDKDERPDPHKRRAASGSIGTGGKTYGLRPKSLLGLPWRYALACIDQLGLILRAEVIWSKPNGLPESVTDRVRRSHEQWFHFTVQPRYFAAVDEIREAHEKALYGRQSVGRAFNSIRNGDRNDNPAHMDGNPLGKLPGSVWSIPTQPLTVPPELGVDHFAAFPMEWPRRLIAGWSPSGVCTGCGEGRRPVVHKGLDLDHMQRRLTGHRDLSEPDSNKRGINGDGANGRTVATVTGYTCGCPAIGNWYHDDDGTSCPEDYPLTGEWPQPPAGAWLTCSVHGRMMDWAARPTAPTTPSVILDVFGGTGTTALVAHVMGRHGISVDLSADYCRLAAWRTTDPGQLAAAAQVEKPARQIPGQDSLFEHLEGA